LHPSFEPEHHGCVGIAQQHYVGRVPGWNKAIKQIKKSWNLYGFQLEPGQVPKEFQGVVLATIVVHFDILGEVSRSLLVKDVRDGSELRKLYGPTLFPLVRPGRDKVILVENMSTRELSVFRLVQ
jgi:hypothetical protein